MLQYTFYFCTWVVNALRQDRMKAEFSQSFGLPVKTRCNWENNQSNYFLGRVEL